MRALVKFCEDQGELILASTLRMKCRPLEFTPGAIALSSDEPGQEAPGQEALGLKLSRLLHAVTGQSCEVTVALSEEGAAKGRTLDEEDAHHHDQQVAEVAGHPLVAAALQTFPGARVASIDVVGDTPDDDLGAGKGETAHA